MNVVSADGSLTKLISPSWSSTSVFTTARPSFVLFADAGDAFDRFGEMAIKQSCGVGLRAVFPQFQRSALRVDVGFPLTPNVLPWSQYHADTVVTFGQAF